MRSGSCNCPVLSSPVSPNRTPVRRVFLPCLNGLEDLRNESGWRSRYRSPASVTPLRRSERPAQNVCSLGIRVLTQRARELNERLWVNSPDGHLRTLARVVYCQRLPDGRFGIGLQFQ